MHLVAGAYRVCPARVATSLGWPPPARELAAVGRSATCHSSTTAWTPCTPRAFKRPVSDGRSSRRDRSRISCMPRPAGTTKARRSTATRSGSSSQGLFDAPAGPMRARA
jgi:hypothetical protein